MEKVGMFKEPSEEWKKRGLNNEYFTKSQRFWGRTIKNKMLLSEGKIMKEQKKATTAIIAAVQEQKCVRCKAENKLYEILRILQWRGADNMISGLAYDRANEQILINKDSLMRAIQYANPGQAYRDIRLVTHEEYKAIKDKRVSDYTSDQEKIRKEKIISVNQ